MWKRYRFYTSSVEDYRPLICNPAYPYWCSGFASDESYSVIIAYLPADENLLLYWDDATEIMEVTVDEITFTDRFPEPEIYAKYWKNKTRKLKKEAKVNKVDYGKVKIPFKKYKGQNMEVLLTSDKGMSYLHWLNDLELRDGDFKTAVKTLFADNHSKIMKAVNKLNREYESNRSSNSYSNDTDYWGPHWGDECYDIFSPGDFC